MAEINETPSIAPVLPTGTRNTIRQDQRRPAQQRDPRERRQPQQQGPDDQQHVDEYA